MNNVKWTVEGTHIINATEYKPVGDVETYSYEWIVTSLYADNDEWEGSFSSPIPVPAETLIKRIMVFEFDQDEYEVIRHADYPHIAGYLHDCEACMEWCHCDNGSCVHCD